MESYHQPSVVDTLREFCRAHHVMDVGDRPLDEIIDLVLDDRGMFEMALDGVVTKDEAVNVLLERVYTEIILPRGIACVPEEQVDSFRRALRKIIFGTS